MESEGTIQLPMNDILNTNIESNFQHIHILYGWHEILKIIIARKIASTSTQHTNTITKWQDAHEHALLFACHLKKHICM